MGPLPVPLFDLGKDSLLLFLELMYPPSKGRFVAGVRVCRCAGVRVVTDPDTIILSANNIAIRDFVSRHDFVHNFRR